MKAHSDEYLLRMHLHYNDGTDPKWRADEKSVPSRQSKSSDTKAVDLNAMQANRTQPSTSTEDPMRNSDNFEPLPEVLVGMEEQAGDPNASPGFLETNADGDEWDAMIDGMIDDECMEEEVEATAMQNALIAASTRREAAKGFVESIMSRAAPCTVVESYGRGAIVQ